MTTESEGRKVKEQLIDAVHLRKPANIGNILVEFYSTSAKAPVFVMLMGIFTYFSKLKLKKVKAEHVSL